MKGSGRREQSFDTAEAETLGMWGNSMRENREAPQTPTHDGGVGRSKKAKSRNVDMHVCGESDGFVVPTKRANKAGAYALAAESAEERRAPNVRIDVAFGKKWKAGREREKGSESTTNGRVSQSGSTKVSESGVAVGGGSGAGVGSIERVCLSMEQALW